MVLEYFTFFCLQSLRVLTVIGSVEAPAEHPITNMEHKNKRKPTKQKKQNPKNICMLSLYVTNLYQQNPPKWIYQMIIANMLCLTAVTR